MRAGLLILFCLVLAACGRPLTETERAFMADLQGDSFDPTPVRIIENRLVGLGEQTYPVRPRTTCRERILPPPQGDTITGSTAGIAFYNSIHIRPGFFLEDYATTEGGALNLSAAMFFAHEMTHVWQWQNRAVTGYRPARAFSEHLTTEDPYLFQGEGDAGFLDYGFEQQASLVEEYVCCRALDPHGARTDRLARLIGAAMPLGTLQQSLAGRDILLPWDGVELRGICS